MRFVSLALACFLAVSTLASTTFAQCNPGCQCQSGGQCSCEACPMQPHLADPPVCANGQCSLGARPAVAHPVRSVLKVAAAPAKVVCHVAQRRPVRTLLRGALCGRRCR